MFDSVDDVLIERVFQPVTDLIRTATGWSKRVPIATMNLSAAVTLIPFGMLLLSMGRVGLFLGVIILLANLALALSAYALLQKEFQGDVRGDTQFSETLDRDRLEGRVGRINLLILSLLMLPGIASMLLFTDEQEPGVRFFIYILALNASAYFRACTDLPPGKNIFIRAWEWLTEAFLAPAHAPARR